jgi:hypothetical protein
VPIASTKRMAFTGCPLSQREGKRPTGRLFRLKPDSEAAFFDRRVGCHVRWYAATRRREDCWPQLLEDGRDNAGPGGTGG